MNSDVLEGKWKQLKGKVREKWGKLTDSDLKRIAGKRDQLVGVVQERYGLAKEEAQEQVDDYVSTLSADAQESETASERKARGAGRG